VVVCRHHRAPAHARPASLTRTQPERRSGGRPSGEPATGTRRAPAGSQASHPACCAVDGTAPDQSLTRRHTAKTLPSGPRWNWNARPARCSCPRSNWSGVRRDQVRLPGPGGPALRKRGGAVRARPGSVGVHRTRGSDRSWRLPVGAAHRRTVARRGRPFPACQRIGSRLYVTVVIASSRIRAALRCPRPPAGGSADVGPEHRKFLRAGLGAARPGILWE
jgi:hypothetical protein